jgi:hypothetical protein
VLLIFFVTTIWVQWLSMITRIRWCLLATVRQLRQRGRSTDSLLWVRTVATKVNIVLPLCACRAFAVWWWQSRVHGGHDNDITVMENSAFNAVLNDALLRSFVGRSASSRLRYCVRQYFSRNDVSC